MNLFPNRQSVQQLKLVKFPGPAHVEVEVEPTENGCERAGLGKKNTGQEYQGSQQHTSRIEDHSTSLSRYSTAPTFTKTNRILVLTKHGLVGNFPPESTKKKRVCVCDGIGGNFQFPGGFSDASSRVSSLDSRVSIGSRFCEAGSTQAGAKRER